MSGLEYKVVVQGLEGSMLLTSQLSRVGCLCYQKKRQEKEPKHGIDVKLVKKRRMR